MAATPIRYVFLVLAVIIGLHFILSVSNETYSNATSLDNLRNNVLGTGAYDPVSPGDIPPAQDAGRLPHGQDGAHTTSIHTTTHYSPSKGGASNGTYGANGERRANAVFVLLARNGDLNGVVQSMKQMEDRFNKRYNYPYVFLNEEPFDDAFKKRVTDLTDAKVEFGLIPKEHWYQPEWVDEVRATEARKKMVSDKVIYGGSVPYRNMCRFNSGFFFRHELLKNYKYYWRIEPDVKFFCDLDYDPFLVMQDGNKVYGFTISLLEYEATIPTLWTHVKNFINSNKELVPAGNAIDFLSDDGGETYNRCHFWSNFEIGDLDFWRGEAYMKFFEYLDEQGGFYYERWGDAPVHSIGAALFAKKEQIHFFEDIGYRHEPFQHCPQGNSHKKGKCWCAESDNFDREWYSCLNKFDKLSAGS